MPLLGLVVLIIQICFAYHALKSGRPYWWLFVIMAFPVVGCLLYYFIDDWGGAMGRWGKYFTRSKWNADSFLKQRFDLSCRRCVRAVICALP